MPDRFMVYIWRFKRFPESLPSPLHMQVLLYLKNNGPKTSGELARALDSRPEKIRRILQHMRRMGLVEVVWIPSRTLESYDEGGEDSS